MHPGQTPGNILPLSHVCNFDQSPQSVEPIATTTLGMKGAGEAGMKGAGEAVEFLRGGSRSKNEEIARAISCLDGAREVDKNDVRQWMANARRSQLTHPSGK